MTGTKLMEKVVLRIAKELTLNGFVQREIQLLLLYVFQNAGMDLLLILSFVMMAIMMKIQSAIKIVLQKSQVGTAQMDLLRKLQIASQDVEMVSQQVMKNVMMVISKRKMDVKLTAL